MKYNIGDLVKDEDGCEGIVCIKYEDGDICAIENDAAHSNPVVVGRYSYLGQSQKRKKGVENGRQTMESY
jgi:hypothetical protein